MRRAEPMRFGVAVSQNCSGTDSVIPTLTRLMTTIAQIAQMQKPRCSAKTDQSRFLRAMRLPVASQKRSSSGSQWSIQRPRRLRAAALADAAAEAGVPDTSMVVLMAGDPVARRRLDFDLGVAVTFRRGGGPGSRPASLRAVGRVPCRFILKGSAGDP